MRTHGRFVAVVEHRCERPWREVTLAAHACILRTGGHEAPSNLGGNHRQSLRALQRLSQPYFTESEAIERRGVEVANPGGERFAHRGASLVVGQLAIQVADGGAPESELADFEP